MWNIIALNLKEDVKHNYGAESRCGWRLGVKTDKQSYGNERGEGESGSEKLGKVFTWWTGPGMFY